MNSLWDQFRGSVPHVVGALVLLIVGFFVALLISRAVRALVRRSGLDRRIAERAVGRTRAQQTDIAPIVGRLVFWLIMIMVLIAVFQALGLTLVSTPLLALLTGVLAFLPKILGAAILIVIAWVVATILRTIVYEALRGFGLDERVSRQSGGETTENVSLSRSLSEAVYWLVWLFFLPTILGTLGLVGLLVPVQVLLNTILGFIPRLFSAIVILVVGLFVARIVRGLVTNLLAALGLDAFAARMGLARGRQAPRISSVLGLVVYVLILIPVITAALDALKLGAITAPISNMLNTILAAIPNIFAAAIVIALAVVIGRVLGQLVTSILAGLGFDMLPMRLGLGAATLGGPTASRLVGRLVEAAVILFALIAALNLLGFLAVAALFAGFTYLAGHIILGLIVFAVGLFLARWAARTIRASGTSPWLAFAARAAILVLFGAMALREFGIAGDIINLAFGLMIGAVAVASAIAFGIGGREVAHRELERWVNTMRTQEPPVQPPPTPPTPPAAGPLPPRPAPSSGAE